MKAFECPICYEAPMVEPYSTKCDHSFCKTCITDWLKIQESCPYCRTMVKSASPDYALQQRIEETAQKAKQVAEKSHELQENGAETPEVVAIREEKLKAQKLLGKSLLVADLEGIERALKQGADPAKPWICGKSYLNTVCKLTSSKRFTAAEMLIKHGVIWDSEEKPQKLLKKYLSRHDLEGVSWILKHGADPCRPMYSFDRESYLSNILQWKGWNERFEACKMLIEHGAFRNPKGASNEKAWPDLYRVIECAPPDLLRLALEKGAMKEPHNGEPWSSTLPIAIKSGDREKLDILTSVGEPWQISQEALDEALCDACQYSPHLVDYLLEKGTNLKYGRYFENLRCSVM